MSDDLARALKWRVIEIMQAHIKFEARGSYRAYWGDAADEIIAALSHPPLECTEQAPAGGIVGDGIEIHPNRCGGSPVLAGHRFTVAQMLAELADGYSAKTLAEEYDLEQDLIERALRTLAKYAERHAELSTEQEVRDALDATYRALRDYQSEVAKHEPMRSGVAVGMLNLELSAVYLKIERALKSTPTESEPR